jgi:hypothetical protein
VFEEMPCRDDLVPWNASKKCLEEITSSPGTC